MVLNVHYIFAAPGVHTPKSAGKSAGSKSDSSDAKNLKQTRRRLSVMSDNKLIEGIDGVSLENEAQEPEVCD